ncbi:cytochrome c-type biogenesis protein [Stappia sp. ES.058]|uniref:cytochrome c-type biogenesis protein n=1 Tax=Stappia sp. ES.058 TaxID=1881061 RepID=UPI000879AD13|nr:cytochrome c-type biogenesis protein [Stappia sp. ES.058]SDT99305.1 cytochrome c-type biogenesis protein CcmH [Stappia sp. ES.058]
MRNILLAILAGLAVILAALPASAVAPDEILDDPALEQRARELSANLRCMVCQNQSIDDSDAPLAKDLRVLVRERLVAGDTNAEVIDYLVARYGEFVLLKPRFSWNTFLLWAVAPLALLLGGAALLIAARRRTRTLATARTMALSDKEQADLDRILADESAR